MEKINSWRALGVAGLVPFISLPLLNAASEVVIGQSNLFAFICYSSAILSFLAGTLWLQGKTSGGFSPTLCSNLITLLAFIALLLDQQIGLILLLIGYLLVFWLELHFKLFDPKPTGYKTMRAWLTVTVVLSHLAFFVQTSAV